MILNEVWKEVESVCLNTEELLAEVKMVNDQRTTENIVVGPADVKALYPRLDIPFTVNKVCEVFHTSGVKVAGVDHGELGLYLALHRTSTELEQMSLSPFCPTRKKKRGRSSFNLREDP